MICGSCKKENKEDSRFCMYCGCELKPEFAGVETENSGAGAYDYEASGTEYSEYNLADVPKKRRKRPQFQ